PGPAEPLPLRFGPCETEPRLSRSMKRSVRSEALAACSLPRVGNQAKTHSPHVLRIPRQVSLQDFLLVEKSPQKYEHEGHDETEGPPRTERERHSDEEPDSAGVHWMTHVCVRPGVDNVLISLHAYVGRGEMVDPGHPEDEQEGQHDQPIAKDRNPWRNRRPAVSVIERGHDDQCKEGDVYQ